MVRNNTAVVGTMIIIFLCLQAIFLGLQTRESPQKTALRFAKSYYALDPAMAADLCSDLRQAGGQDPVAAYLRQVDKEAYDRGLPKVYLKNWLIKHKTHTVLKDNQRAEVHLTGYRRTMMNPLYAWVARWFCIGKTHPVDETLQLIKEDNGWKVCGGLLPSIPYPASS